MVLGFAIMVALVGLGLDVILQRYPQILPVMRVAGALYMVWLALKIALAKPIGKVASGGGRSASSPPPAFNGSIRRPG